MYFINCINNIKLFFKLYIIIYNLILNYRKINNLIKNLKFYKVSYAILSIGILGFIVWSFKVGTMFYINFIQLCYMLERLFMLIFKIIFTQSKYFSYLKNNIFIINSDQQENSPSSETTNINYFNFSIFIEHYKFIDHKWLEWFVGFSEGDGSWLIQGNRLFFVITQKEIDVLYHIQKTLGFGLIIKDSKGYTRYVVTHRKDILSLILLFSGNIVLSKRLLQFNKWVITYNTLTNNNFQLYNNTTKLTLESAWLSGFTDAEGCFNVFFSIRKNSILLRSSPYIRFILDQQFEKECLLTIASLFNTGSVNLRRETNEVYRYCISSFVSIPVIIQYFDKFPLKTHKQNSFIKWSKIYYIIVNKEHLSLSGLDKIIKLAKSINVHDKP